MSVRPIRLFGDPVLKSTCTEITQIDAKIRALVDDLVDSVQLEGRAGVAANQIGVGLRAFSYNVDGRVGYLLNPRLIDVSGEPELVGEGCLSVPGLWFEVKRYPHAKAVGTDLDGNEVILEGDGLLAQAIQHEIDHLEGMLYLDRLDRETRRAALKEVRESDWF
jgi:peptide deformylase